MPGMKWMMYLMPVMFLVFFNEYAAGLSYYYFLSLLITIIQTYVFRRVIDEKKVRAQLLENTKKPRKKADLWHVLRKHNAVNKQCFASNKNRKENANNLHLTFYNIY